MKLFDLMPNMPCFMVIFKMNPMLANFLYAAISFSLDLENVKWPLRYPYTIADIYAMKASNTVNKKCSA